jgi:hypothetical protein
MAKVVMGYNSYRHRRTTPPWPLRAKVAGSALILPGVQGLAELPESVGAVLTPVLGRVVAPGAG